MAVQLYGHPDNGVFVGGLCAPRDFRTRSELLCKRGLYARPTARMRGGVLVCDYCGAVLCCIVGEFHVLKWRGDGKYRAEDAAATYSRRGSAEACAYRLGCEYVVRAF